MNEPIRAVVFDLDDTLIEEEPARDEALRRATAPARDRGVDPARLASDVRSRARELWWAHPLHDWAHGIGVASWEALWARFEGQAPELLELAAWAQEYRVRSWTAALADQDLHDPALAADLARRFARERRTIHRTFPDARPVLAALRRDGRVRVGVLTNGLSCLQREKFAGSGLRDLVDAFVAGGDVGSRKPHRAVFDHVLDRLDAKPAEALMVGNNPETDVAGALAAGLRAILVERPGLPPREIPPEAARAPRVRDLLEVAGRLGVDPG